MRTKTIATIQMVALFLLFTHSLFAHFENKDFLDLSNIDTSISNDEKSTYIDFIKGQSFQKIKEIAKKNNKPIFVDFYAHWCGPCNLMDQEVFSDSSVASYMNANFINYKADVNTRTGNSLASRYDIKLLPTLIIISADGEILTQASKFMDSTEFMNFAKGAIM